MVVSLRGILGGVAAAGGGGGQRRRKCLIGRRVRGRGKKCVVAVVAVDEQELWDVKYVQPWRTLGCQRRRRWSIQSPIKFSAAISPLRRVLSPQPDVCPFLASVPPRARSSSVCACPSWAGACSLFSTLPSPIARHRPRPGSIAHTSSLVYFHAYLRDRDSVSLRNALDPLSLPVPIPF